MLNEKIMSVFDAVMKYLSAGEYVVVPKSDVREALDGALTQSEIDASMNALQMNELVQIRYADSEVYCLTVLPKGIREDERREEQREEQRRKEALIAAENERKAAIAAAEAAAAEAKTDPANELDADTDDANSETDEEKSVEKAQSTESSVMQFNYKKAAIICGLSAFLGAFFAGILTLIIILSKVG